MCERDRWTKWQNQNSFHKQYNKNCVGLCRDMLHGICYTRYVIQDHLDRRLELYVEGKLSASQQSILMTK